MNSQEGYDAYARPPLTTEMKRALREAQDMGNMMHHRRNRGSDDDERDTKKQSTGVKFGLAVGQVVVVGGIAAATIVTVVNAVRIVFKKGHERKKAMMWATGAVVAFTVLTLVAQLFIEDFITHASRGIMTGMGSGITFALISHFVRINDSSEQNTSGAKKHDEGDKSSH